MHLYFMHMYYSMFGLTSRLPLPRNCDRVDIVSMYVCINLEHACIRINVSVSLIFTTSKVVWFSNQQKRYPGLNQSKINIFRF